MKHSQQQKQRGIRKINSYDFEFLRDRYNEEYPEFAHEFNTAVAELRKFFTLMFETEGPMAAMSHSIDALWHLFIQHTPQYEAFCNEAFGQYVHHQPRSATYPVPTSAISTFYTAYPKQFGLVPSIWFNDIPSSERDAIARGEVPFVIANLKWSGWTGWKN